MGWGMLTMTLTVTIRMRRTNGICRVHSDNSRNLCHTTHAKLWLIMITREVTTIYKIFFQKSGGSEYAIEPLDLGLWWLFVWPLKTTNIEKGLFELTPVIGLFESSDLWWLFHTQHLCQLSTGKSYHWCKVSSNCLWLVHFIRGQK